MIRIRHSEERGATQTPWLESKHSFSFGGYHDAANMGFGPLRVINEDWVAPGTGFDMHGHANMEIITYVLSGALAHKDSLGNSGEIRPGEIQVMSAGKGILHSEQNPSPDEEVHLLQIWIMPNETRTRPEYHQRAFDRVRMKNALMLLASPDGAEGSMTIRQDARLYAAGLEAGAELSVNLEPQRRYWLQVAKGSVTFAGKTLRAGDGAAVENEASLAGVSSADGGEILFFDLPR